MAASKKRPRKRSSASARRAQPRYVRNVTGAIMIIAALFAILHSGWLGLTLANVLRLLVGDSYVILGLVVIWIGFGLLAFAKFPRITSKWWWISGLVTFEIVLISTLVMMNHYATNNAVEVIFSFWRDDFRSQRVTVQLGGGLAGAYLFTLLVTLLGRFGAYLISALLMVALALILTDKHFGDLIRWSKQGTSLIQQGWKKGCLLLKNWRQQRLEAKSQHKVKPASSVAPPVESLPEQPSVTTETVEPFTVSGGESVGDLERTVTSTSSVPAVSPSSTASTVVTQQQRYINYQLPQPEILTAIPPADQSQEKTLIKKNRDLLQQTLANFGVDAQVVHADLGPTVTKYEVKPAVGVKVNKIVNLADDLALALAAKDIRIEAPIPGKPYVGIEVPNKTVATVSFRQVITQQQFSSQHILEVPLGKSVTGTIMTADLTKMPHLLIAGSTGSGKSVMINTIITSLLMHARPDQVKLMLIDPKMVELNIYNDIPHLLLPVVTNPKRATNALNKAVKIMEERYQTFAEVGVRSMTEYNEKIATQTTTAAGDMSIPPMPYIVIIVDELSDLMMVAGREVESAIVRLSQMARAAGIHLIIATQRPSVDVITGLIKANIPSRIAFAVSSGIDSRTILDSVGAERLLGRGDMLFLPVSLSKPVRVQGAYIPTQDVEQVVQFVKQQQDPDYDEELVAKVNQEGDEEDTHNDQDELYEAAVEFVVRQQKASVSMVQRQFRVGYNRAARLIDSMASEQIVGPSEGAKGRQVLVTLEQWQATQHKEEQQ